jgi:ribitol 2-dehydrogenase
MQQALAGKVVIITGASSGIGAAAARCLAGLGCRVALAARSTARLQALAEELGPAALAIPADVTSAAGVERMVSQTLSAFERIDVLLANAGVYLPGQMAGGAADAWTALIDVNVNGVLRCIHAVLPCLLEQRSGDILITASISGYIDIQWEPVYSASKHAVVSLAHTLRRQVAAAGIRVSSIAPGMVANELWGITDPADIARRPPACGQRAPGPPPVPGHAAPAVPRAHHITRPGCAGPPHAPGATIRRMSG